ncbi:CHAT domain-containing protein [Chloroflexus sp.]|uniref:CHAT domain-containing protein n=1 Tax=Chloroflexus sp. TaxID=1904827 RepID=UPI0026378EFA|nr:CHAT domain-containing protein [uncultured Chloroflexus sp.]
MDGLLDLELSLRGLGHSGYAVTLSFSDPDSDADVRVERGSSEHPIRFNLEQLRELAADPVAYGTALGAMLFSESEILAQFTAARALARRGRRPIPIRFRLFIAPSAAELHALRWETLRMPDGEPLLLGEEFFFSRYLTSNDVQPIRARSRNALRVLIAIAHPVGIEQFGLAPVDVAGELARARAGFAGFDLVELVEPGAATLDQIIETLRAEVRAGQPFDIVYLVAHGSYVADNTYLWLVKPDNSFERVNGEVFTQRLRELSERPRLVMLIACQSGGGLTANEGALSALGPRLAEAGVPAVIAMQGNVSMRLVEQFVPVFCQELQRDGLIDAAMAIARGAVRDLPDHWMPALYSRLKSGRIWYVPGFADEQDTAEKIEAIASYMADGICTPVIGPHLVDTRMSMSRMIAQHWAKRYHYPMEIHEREQLAYVAQFLSIKYDYRFPRRLLLETFQQLLVEEYREVLPDLDQLTLRELLSAIGRYERARDPFDPYRVLAAQPIPIYIMANAAHMLCDALVEAGKQPVVELCRWNDDLDRLPSIFEREPEYRPSIERPLIFHLFGSFDQLETLVLTEDDYFDFLINISAERERVPAIVRDALADSALLFLGFELEDISFRALFHSLIKPLRGGSRRRRYVQVAGQLMPREDQVLQPDRAIRYLEAYFQDTAAISVFWGSPRDFCLSLSEHLAELGRSGRRRGF